MSRDYFADTNAVVGYVYLSDRWYQEVRPLYQDSHNIHLTDIVLYEYCNRDYQTDPPRPDDPEQVEINWNPTGGVHQKVEKDLKQSLPQYIRKVREKDRDEITLEDGIEIFIDQFEIREEARPQIESYFSDYFDDRANIPRYFNKCAQDLIDHILQRARKNHSELKATVHHHDSSYHEFDRRVIRWTDFLDDEFVYGGQEDTDIDELDDPWDRVKYDEEGDLAIVVDAEHINRKVNFRHLVTGDSDLLQAQDIANEYFDMSIISIADEFSPESSVGT